jgi:hypothetical protein
MHRRQFVEGALGAGLFAAWQTKQGAAASPALAPIPGADPSGVQDSSISETACIPAVHGRAAACASGEVSFQCFPRAHFPLQEDQWPCDRRSRRSFSIFREYACVPL